jgi:hypothetical protein
MSTAMPRRVERIAGVSGRLLGSKSRKAQAEAQRAYREEVVTLAKKGQKPKREKKKPAQAASQAPSETAPQ